MTREPPQGTHGTPAWLGDVEPGEFDPDLDAPQTSEPLWPRGARTEPITVSYVKPGWDQPTGSFTATGWAPGPDGESDAGLGTLGLLTVTGRRPMRPPAAPHPGSRASHRYPRRGAGAGLAALVLLALLSAFFAWVTAEPLWLALGHSTAGTVTVTRCVDDGLNRRCTGTFTSADGRFTRAPVPVMGDAPAAGAGAGTAADAGAGPDAGPAAGERVSAPARMTSARGHRAYVDVDAGARAATGVALIVLCGLAIARATGVRRLPTRRARVLATLVALAGPLLLQAAILAATY